MRHRPQAEAGTDIVWEEQRQSLDLAAWGGTLSPEGGGSSRRMRAEKQAQRMLQLWENKFSKVAGAVPAPIVLPTYHPRPPTPIHRLPRPLGKWPGRYGSSLGKTAVQASCLLQGINWHCHGMWGHLAPAQPTPIPFNFLLPGSFAFTFKGMLFLFFSVPCVRHWGHRDKQRSRAGPTQPEAALSITVSPGATHGPLRA